MDVHPPHEPVHSWRDAALHLLIVTIGLFIALSLEGLIEYVHHRELVKRARENIRIELQQNHENAVKDAQSLADDAKRMQGALDTMHRMQQNPDAHGSIGFHWSYSDLSDAAFRSARDTGALGYMPYDEVQTYASLYRLQNRIVDQVEDIQTREGEMLAPILAQPDGFKRMPDAQFQGMTLGAATTMLRLQTLGQLMKGLDASYLDTLKQTR